VDQTSNKDTSSIVMHGICALLSFGLLNAVVYHTSASTALSEAASFYSEGLEANGHNSSTDSSSHKGGLEHGGFVFDQQQGVLDTLYCSLEESVVSDTCQQAFTYGAMGSMEQSHFKKIQSFKVDYTEAEVTQYESQRTGMRVSVVDRKGPKVCCATTGGRLAVDQITDIRILCFGYGDPR
jgi:hypothetical protein